DPSCTNPVDPDCTTFCGPDGICQASGCAQPDPDCNPACAVDGAPCDDMNACTTPDVCMAGVCIGTNAFQCDPMDDCHVASCNPATGNCDSTPLSDGTPCMGGTCMGGVCTPVMSASSTAVTSTSVTSTSVTSTSVTSTSVTSTTVTSTTVSS